jgi:hypothetical protein
MKKLPFAALILVLVLALAAESLYILFINKPVALKPIGGTETPAITPGTPIPMNFTVANRFEFDNFYDQDLLTLFAIDQQPSPLSPDAAFLKDGVLHMDKNNALGEARPVMKVHPGSIVHVRLRTGENGPCFFAMLSNPLGSGIFQNLRVTGCPGHELGMDATKNQLGSSPLQASIPSYGMASVSADQWIDVIFWLNDKGDSVFYFAGDPTDVNHLFYGSVGLPSDWQTTNWEFSFGGYFHEEKASPETYVEVDFVRYSYGNITDYLTNNLPGYLANQTDVDTVLSSSVLPVNHWKFVPNT